MIHNRQYESSNGEKVRERRNWKKANGETYDKAFRATLDERKDKICGVMNQVQLTWQSVEETANAIPEAHRDAGKRTVPATRIC